MENYLVCGNSPCLIDDLKGKSLSRFDKVIRVNAWEPIKYYDNRCDAWVFYPLHHPRSDGSTESRRYDLEKYFWVKEKWIVHPFTVEPFVELFPNESFKCMLTLEQRDRFCAKAEIPVPTTGMLAIAAAMYLENVKVYTAGFDFYQNMGNDHYFDDGVVTTEFTRHHPHDVVREAEYYKELVGNKQVTLLRED